MKIFISWSGERSSQLATALGVWLPKVIQTIKPWLSSNIDAGGRWNDEVSHALEEMQCGVLCLTPENLQSPWVSFEAGALSKAVSASRVIPYLLGFEPRELEGPLSQFQAVRADQEGTFRLVSTLHNVGDQPLGSSEILAETFHLWWPRLEPEIDRIKKLPRTGPRNPSRSAEDMLGEVLELLRSRRLNEPLDDLSSLVPAETPSIGAIVRALRVKRRWTPNELSSRAGLPAPTIVRVENGSLRPSVVTLRQIGNAFNVNLFGLVEGDLPEEDLPS
jgi:DNA-binding XRE family transcriptional regulator